MLIIKHRVNTIEALSVTSTQFGVEIDIRSENGDLIISHDPFIKGVNFELWLNTYSHQFLVLNVKEDGLENKLMEKLSEHSIDNFFFLDQSFPSLYKISRLFPEKCAVRVSDIESSQTALNLKPKWVWLDSHSGDWSFLIEAIQVVKGLGMKVCLVSPELQRSNFKDEMLLLKRLLLNNDLELDAVCTKLPINWLL
jgi:hypothetical protein